MRLLILAVLAILCPWQEGSAAPPAVRPPGVENSEQHQLFETDPRWGQFSGYLNLFELAIERRWYDLLEARRHNPPRGSHVVVTFKLNAEGRTTLVKVENVGSDKAGVAAATDAICSKKPYTKWTSEMIAALGHEQTLSFAFYYQ